MRNGDDKLWKIANDALAAGHWGAARAALDDLNRYHKDSAVDAMAVPAGTPDFVRDRVELWNSYVERRAS